MEFEVGDRVMLKAGASPRAEQSPPYFHVSNLKECYADEPLVMPLKGIHVDDRLQFVEEPVEIMERESKERNTHISSQTGLRRPRVMLKVSHWKGVVQFGKRDKLNPRYVIPFKVLSKVGTVAYRLELPQELSRVHHNFYVSNLKKCYADEPLVMPLKGIHVDDRLQFVEEPVEIMERESKG
nr:putative reverse transcriptase domain-containing protein [Tanacetum cinerariifolium]